MKITKRTIESTQPGEKEKWVWCDTLPGFGIRVHPSGVKQYVVRYRTTANSQRKFTIGPVDQFTPDQARDRAREIMADARSGGDPMRERSEFRKSPTVADLAAAHQSIHKPPTIKEGTARNYEILWRRHILPRIGSMKVADMTVPDIQFRLHMDMAETPYNANRALELVSKALADCERWNWRPLGSNPAKYVPAFPEKERQRILSPDEIRRLMNTLNDYDQSPKNVWSISWLVRLLVLTGLRVSEWSCSEWGWVSFERQTLTLPDSKVGGRVVHLSDAAIQVLKDLKRFRPHVTPWIIPNSEFTGPMKYPHEHWERIREKTHLEGVRLHDIRHTFGSLGHMAGLSQKEIAEQLGHRQLRTTERYLHVYDETKRTAANKASAAVLKFADG